MHIPFFGAFIKNNQLITFKMFDIRKIAVIFVIAILFSIFTFTTIDAIHPGPEYSDFCNETFKIMQTQENCEAKGGIWNPDDLSSVAQYNCQELTSDGNDVTLDCRKNLERPGGYCDAQFTCQKDFEKENEKHQLFVFIAAALFGIIGIVYGMYANPKDDIKQWIGSGFMIGGLINVFFGTISYFQYTSRIVRPLIIFVELALVIYVAIKQFSKK